MQRINLAYATTVLTMLRQGKTEKQISLETKKHRNTVSSYVKWLKNNQVFDLQLVRNELLEQLQTRMPDMQDRDLIRFYAVITPQQIETRTDENVIVTAPWLNKYVKSPLTITSPISDSKNSTIVKPDSVCSVAADAGVKTTAQSTKP